MHCFYEDGKCNQIVASINLISVHDEHGFSKFFHTVSCGCIPLGSGLWKLHFNSEEEKEEFIADMERKEEKELQGVYEYALPKDSRYE